MALAYTTSMEQIEYWNGPAGERWAAQQASIDASLAPITELLFAYAAPRAGETVLDIGCGSGTTTLRLAALGCDPTGIDVSAPQLAVARARGVRTIEGDAAKAPGSYGLGFSRFGVMFFTDPRAAFAHLRSITRRLAFVCWRSFEQNAWASEPVAAVRDLLPKQPPPDPRAPGPFAFADRAWLEELVPGAEITAADTTMFMGSVEEAVAEAQVRGPLSRAAAELDAATRARIVERLPKVFERHARPDGVHLPASVWLVRT